MMYRYNLSFLQSWKNILYIPVMISDANFLFEDLRYMQLTHLMHHIHTSESLLVSRNNDKLSKWKTET